MFWMTVGTLTAAAFGFLCLAINAAMGTGGGEPGIGRHGRERFPNG